MSITPQTAQLLTLFLITLGLGEAAYLLGYGADGSCGNRFRFMSRGILLICSYYLLYRAFLRPVLEAARSGM